MDFVCERNQNFVKFCKISVKLGDFVNFSKSPNSLAVIIASLTCKFSIYLVASICILFYEEMQGMQQWPSSFILHGWEGQRPGFGVSPNGFVMFL